MTEPSLPDTPADRAVRLFRSGFNCAQSVFCAFAEEFGMDFETARKVSSGLGGGIGRMRETCGTVTGAALVLGMRHGPDKADVYPGVQEFYAAFRAETGSVVCRELLAGTGATQGGAPEARTPGYYRRRPCVELVRLAAELLSR
ncbi:MAG: C-GCAxxG-C-C family protein [Kiritimatiellia bacterium]|jgi:C_GCAxxG_C_C family probable redox protein